MSISIVNVPVPTSGDGPIVSVADLVGEKTVELSGTFRGKYLILGTQNGAMFVPVALFDSDGKEDLKQTLPLAMLAVKVRSLADEAVGVAVNVSGVLSVGANKFATVASVAPGVSGAQPVVDLFAVFAPDEIEQDIGFMCSGGFRGVVRVLGSLDGVEFNPIGMFTADLQPSSLVSLPPMLTFSPMPTRDLVRYVKVVVDGDVSNTVTVTVGGSIPAAGGVPVIVPVATWTGCRYIFLDGDGGDDAHVGYIDAPLGTDFTSSMAQVAAVAVKTTHRINEIRPAVGAGRACVVLLKPRVGGAVYDLLTPGDALGSEDRSQLSGYSLLHTRGSDLTNSAADKAQLGFSTARNDPSYVGPNPDGSFTVGAVTAGSGDGPEVQLLTANFADAHSLLKYRARFVTAGGATIYAPIRWGATSSIALDVVTFWFIPGPGVSPGDEVWLERPGVALNTVSDAPTYAAAISTAPASSVAGIEVTANTAVEFNVGTNDDTSANLCGVLSIYCKGRGTVVFAPEYIDETGNGSGPPSTSSFLTTHDFEGESWSGNLFNTTNAFTIQAASQTGQYCHFGYGTFDEASEYFSLFTCDFEGVTLSPANMVGVIGCRFYPTGAGISLTVQPRSLGGADSGSVEVSIVDYCMLGRAGDIAGGGDPSLYPWPSICLKNGQYTTLLDFQAATELSPATIQDGLGVQVEYSDDSSQFSLVTYDSLKTTGFEVIGGQKVVCKATGADTGYAGDLYPCPRGTAMKILDASDECGQHPPNSPCGLVVFGSNDSGHDQAFFAFNNDLNDPVHNVLGATLTNYKKNVDFGDGTTGGFVLVSDDAILALRRTASSTAPTPGVPVYLASQEGIPPIIGAFTVEEYFSYGALSTSSFCLGYVLPIGDPGGAYATVAWQPGRHYNQVRAALDNFVKTSDVTLQDVPGLFVQLEAGKSYKIRAHLYYNTGGSPGNGGLKVALDGSATATFAWFSVVGMQERADSPGTPIVPLLEWVATMVALGDGSAQSHTGGVAGWVDIEGVVKVNTSGSISVRFAQETSSAGSSSLGQGSSLTAIRNF